MKINRTLILKAIVSLGLIVLVFTRIDIKQVWFRVHYLSLPFVIFALLYYTGCQWLSSLRWQVVLRSIGYRVSSVFLLGTYFAGMFVNIFLPSSFGGDVYRVYRVVQKTQDSEAALASVLLERFMGLAAMTGLGLSVLPLAFKLIGRWDIILIFIICVVLLVGAVLLVTSPQLLIWVEPWFLKFHLSGLAGRFAKLQILMRKFARSPRELALSMGISLLVQLSIIYYLFLLGQQLKIPISYLELLIFMPISIVVTLLPISLGGLGLQEGLWSYLFSTVGITSEQAVSLSLTFTVLGWILSLPGSLVLLLDSAKFQSISRNDK